MTLKFLTLILILFFSSCNTQPAWTECLAGGEPKNLWQGLIGEAVSEGRTGMYAVACVYHNRLIKNMPLGCVALKRKDLSKFVERQGKKYELMAKDIIRKVFIENAPDITRGATHYENIERFGIPYWAKDMVRVCKIGNHTFYLSTN